ncbi:uncharacterized protein si:zfos-1056e6.1 [Osmerus mordax]|uniref:uncharacterized protein si:zfos-1056e6.1 n=1 Tax=Osmerus mordax TaxID=8014 RepID=UPI00350F3CDF
MSNLVYDERHCLLKTWIALKRLDQNDERVIALREVSIPKGTDVTSVKQIVASDFGFSLANRALKLRNHRGCLIPLNSSIPANSKHMPYVLEVANIFQHVSPKPRTTATTEINKSMKTRLQSIVRKIERLDELLPQIQLRRHDKFNQEIELLTQKLRFLHKRMQVAEAHGWRGMLVRTPMW